VKRGEERRKKGWGGEGKKEEGRNGRGTHVLLGGAESPGEEMDLWRVGRHLGMKTLNEPLLGRVGRSQLYPEAEGNSFCIWC
jgi:hypothetical protein